MTMNKTRVAAILFPISSGVMLPQFIRSFEVTEVHIPKLIQSLNGSFKSEDTMPNEKKISEDLLRDMLAEQARAWNQGDAITWASFFTEDARFVTLRGRCVLQSSGDREEPPDDLLWFL